ncbi:hypothetical protein [Paenibacillus sp. yr247]|uniref:hypothetical protein n=1 Tax=Paenibacillus sp. yr247 TaxID=1761880 RepID=UPI0011408642|nr:hypothetical protein [Paenibacillus sp. yr247]
MKWYIPRNYQDMPPRSLLNLYDHEFLDEGIYYYVILNAMLKLKEFEMAGEFIQDPPEIVDLKDQTYLYYSGLLKIALGFQKDGLALLKNAIEANPNSRLVSQVAAVMHAYNFNLSAKQKQLLITMYQIGVKNLTIEKLSECTNIRGTEIKKCIHLFIKMEILSEAEYGYEIHSAVASAIKSDLEKDNTVSQRKTKRTKKEEKNKGEGFQIRIVLKSGKEGVGHVSTYPDLQSLVNFFEKKRLEGDELLVFDDFAFRVSEVAWIESIESKIVS